MRILPFVLVLLLSSCTSQKPTEAHDVHLYATDTFMGPESLLSKALAPFEPASGCKMRFTVFKNAAQALNQLELDQKSGEKIAHAVLGVDQSIWNRGKKFWGNASFLSVQYGPFAFMIDREKLASLKIAEPKGLRDLLKPEYRRKLVLSDPRTSTAGTGFLLLTRAVLGAEAPEYWKKLRTQWLTLTPGWSEAYHLFTKGEAPIVWSYVTSQAYHRANGDTKNRYVAVIPSEGTITQEEGLVRMDAHIRDDKTRACLGKFEEFLKSSAVQREIPKTNWMFPSFLPEAEWPVEFKGLQPVGFRARDVEWGSLSIQAALEEWSTWVQ